MFLLNYLGYRQTPQTSFSFLCTPSSAKLEKGIIIKCIAYHSGHIGGGMDEVDDLNMEYKPTVVVRTHQPWHSKISR